MKKTKTKKDLAGTKSQKQGENTEKKPKKRVGGAVALKHKIVLNNLIKNTGKGGKNSIVKAATDAGYSKSYAESGDLVKSETWIKLVDSVIPDSLILAKHRALLEKHEKIYKTDRKGKIIVQDTGEIDVQAVKAGIDFAYKVKGRNAPEKFEVEQTGLQSLSDEDLAALIKKQKARFTKQD